MIMLSVSTGQSVLPVRIASLYLASLYRIDWSLAVMLSTVLAALALAPAVRRTFFESEPPTRDAEDDGRT